MSRPLQPPSRLLPVRPIAFVIAGVFGIATLWSGFSCDDYWLIANLKGLSPWQQSTFDIHRFVGSAEDLARLTAHGPFPWFCAPDLKWTLLRPLSSALLAVDERLFGDNAFGWHVHSVLWYLGLVGAAALVLRRCRFLDRNTLTLALVLFAANDSHWMPLGWIANRHAAVSVTLALLGVWAHMRAREEGWRPGLVLAPALCACALLAGETALGVFAYIGAYELWGRREAIGRRLRALSPTLLLTAAYLVVYKLRGYGTHHSGEYADPIDEPLAFLRVAPRRLLSLIGSFFFGPSADVQTVLPSLSWLWPILGAIALALAYALYRAAMSDLSEDGRRGLRWLLAGALLSFVPCLSALPGSRLLLGPSLGGAALCAVFLVRAWRARVGIGRKIAFGALVLMLAIRPALTLGTFLAAQHHLTHELDRIVRDSELPAAPDVRVVAPVMPDFLVALYPSTMRDVDDKAPVGAWWVLSFAPREHVLTRTAADRIELETVGGPMLETSMERVFRSAALPFHLGDTVELAGMTVRILDEHEGLPTRIEAQFDRSLDDPSMWVIEWRDGLLRRMTLPGVGAQLRIPAQHTPFGF